MNNNANNERGFDNIAVDLATSAYSTSISYLLLGLTLMPALAWNQVVQGLIRKYVKAGESYGEVVYAIIVSIIAAVAHSLVGSVTGVEQQQL